MQIIPSDAFSARDETALAAFLAMCREEAIKAGTSRFASIVVETSFADPLAILENIHQDGFPLWYVERPTDEFALACGESTAYEEFTGEDRFEKAKVFCDDISSTVIATGDLRVNDRRIQLCSCTTDFVPSQMASHAERWTTLRSRQC